jgi:hypothetical protein
VSLPSGVERTISWKAGDSDVKVTDSKPNGEKDRLSVPSGHELPLVPFR